MKKLYFLFVFALAFTTQAQIVNIPDANFKAKLIAASPTMSIASTETPTNIINNQWSVSTYHSIDTNGDGEIQVSEAQAIKYLKIDYSNITNSTGIEAFINLESLMCNNNQISSLNVSGFVNLKFLDCKSNQMNSLAISGCTNMKQLVCSPNQLTSLDVSGLEFLEYLSCSSNQLVNLSVTGCTSLNTLYCHFNQLTSLNVSGFSNLNKLNCSNNQINSLVVLGCTNLKNLNCTVNQLTNLNVSNCINLLEFTCVNNQLTSLDVSNCSNLNYLYCSNNQLLTSLFVKNNKSLPWSLQIYNNPNLQYICADEENISNVQNSINQAGLSATCHVNSYCSFTPGSVFYEITGQTKFDGNLNGCDANDSNYPNLQLNINDGTNNGTFIADTSGNYYIPVGAGIHTVTPVLKSPTYFTISPSNFTVDFPTQTSPFTQDFCVTANDVHSDVEILSIPTTSARPGFDANYKLILKNNGNQIESGNVSFDFDDSVLDFVSSSIVFNSQSTSSNNTTSLVWNYTGLLPFETREIDIVLNVNSPTEMPAVNIDDILGLFAQISTTNTDEDMSDNTSDLRQVVVGSYDPNDKTCMEGETINPSMIGEYVHYVIRFENTGTYPAENIVVRDDIDTTKFDIATLVTLGGSHEFYTRINGNKVEFIFENINLDFNNATNDGYIAFKIKSLPTLTVNNTISNTAKIYFDYNYPIVTNTATSTYQVLNAQSFDFDSAFTLYPNPVKDLLNLQAKNGIAIQSVEIYNIVGQLILALPNAGKTIDVSSLESGSYFIKINTDSGSTSTKFIKE
jgi:Leucine-rich repeat (LRR) protein